MGKVFAIRERPQEIQPLAFAAEHLAALFESTQDLIWSVDLNHRLVTFNKALSDAFTRGYGVEITVGMTPRDLLPPEKAAVFPRHYEKALREGPCSAEYRLADGRFLEMTFNPIIQDGLKVGVSVLGRDVTEQRSARETLLRVTQQYREFFEFAPEAIFRTTTEGKTVAINPAGATLLGYDSPGEAIAVLKDWGRQVWFDPAERSAFIRILERKGQALSGPCQFRRKDGTLFGGIMSARRICGPDGKTLYYQGFMEDTTERKQAEEALRESNGLLQNFIEHTPAAIAMFDRDMRYLAASRVHREAMSILGQDIVGLSHYEVFPELPESYKETHRRGLAGEVVRSDGDRQERADGTVFWHRWELRPWLRGNGEIGGVLLFGEDITELKALELDLRAKVRDLSVLSEMNNALLRAKTEEELLSEYCRIVVEVGGYRMAWVGFAEEGPEKRIIPVAHYGHEDGYLNLLNITWANTERGQGPAARCIRTGEIAVVKDFAADPATARMHDEAAKRGYMSCISIPFRHSEGVMACLTAYGVRVSRWSDAERRLMDQVASALGFGITKLRTALANAQYQESLRVSLEQTIQVIAETVDQRDPYTAGHQRKVADLSVAIAGKLGLSSERTQGLRLAASIHDLGKISVPAEILAKPGLLTENQHDLLKEHVQLGYEIVKNVQFPWPIAQMILQHHERLDGSGYPRGLKADEIFLEARILAVADVIEAMSSHRPYRASRGIDAALDEVLLNSGTLYDPQAVEACVNLFRHEDYQFPPQ